jgi:hypothetical protein
MAHATVSKTEDSSREQIKNQHNGHHFFFDSHEIQVVRKVFVPRGVAVNQKYYLEMLNRLRKSAMWVRKETADDWTPSA